ncbi:MAG TPA: polyketide synthase dehydratase domain-containing protein [Gemmatales bacterium]|nr:polyketide synthase dehydratase domain-containing protein [Gemmatales bacterium]HMP59178.1 polyketide synthase dehydratase domain-containing protein [Gemmatales bacterium]
MRFQLIDQVVDWQAGQELHAVKNLTLAEEYLADHFPGFPVMPGVLMLETLVQAASWLVRLTEDFRPTVVTLREVKGAKYGTFMEPGQQMTVKVEVQGTYDPAAATVALRGVGEKGGQQTVNARFVVAKRRLADSNPALAPVDEQLALRYRQQFVLLQPGRRAG